MAGITGGGSGIGLASARRCSELGMKVVLADLSEANLAEAKAELEAGGGIVKTVVTDVAAQASVQNLHDEVYGDAEFGECAFLFLNVRSLPPPRVLRVCVPLARRACADPVAVRGSHRRAWRSAPRRSRRRWRTGSCSWASTSMA